MTKAHLYIYQEYTCKSLFVIIGASIIAYVIFLGMIMYNASLHTSLSQEISKTTSVLAELEFEYITLKQSVTLEKALELGFVEVKNPNFVEVSNDTAVSLLKVR